MVLLASRVTASRTLLPIAATWSALRSGVSTVVTKQSSGKPLGNPGHVLALESTHLKLKCRGHAQFAPRPGYATRTVRRATRDLAQGGQVLKRVGQAYNNHAVM